MLPQQAPIFILLGRNGDLIQMLPAFKAVFDRTGKKPIVLVSSDYSSLLEGVSYVQPYPMRVGWWDGIPVARQVAAEAFGGGIVVQWWKDDPAHIHMIPEANCTGIVLQCHGNSWGVDIGKWPDYGTSMWDRAGFTREEMISLPLVFDRRVQVREDQLAKNVLGNDKRPAILFNLGGISSPFSFTPEILNPIMNTFGRHFHLVDLSKVAAHRLFDVLGVMDRVRGIITSDTYSLHMAAGSPTPYIAFIVDGWVGSVPKGNCVWSCRYNESPRRLAEILAVIEGWK